MCRQDSHCVFMLSKTSACVKHIRTVYEPYMVYVQIRLKGGAFVCTTQKFSNIAGMLVHVYRDISEIHKVLNMCEIYFTIDLYVGIKS